MQRYKLTIEYDGTGLAGWQKQDDRESVQSLLISAASHLSGAPVNVVGAGRTDAGVHAVAQIAHVDLDREMSGYNMMHAMNYHLLPLTTQVAVTKAEPVSDKFHARFSAIGRSYCYRIVNRRARLAFDLTRAWHIPEKLDIEAMRVAAGILEGHHDFTTFRSSACQSKSPEKTLDRLEIVQEGENIHIYAEARSFLHHQVRNMAGALRLAGNGKWSPERLMTALAAKDRAQGGETAPAQGLCLTGVQYPN